MIIRPIHGDEAQSVGDLLVTAYVTGGHLDADSAYTHTLLDVGSRLDYTLVAEEAGRVVGTVCFCPPDGSSPAVLSEDGEYEFRFLAIEPDVWGRGVGQALVAECEARAVAAGAERMVISVISLNERALTFYAQLGYVRLPERDWSPVRAADPGTTVSASSAPVRILALAKEL